LGTVSSRGLLAVAVARDHVALAVLWLVIVELTRFYFHSNHFQHDGVEVFTPRFTLTGIRLSSDELGPATDAAYKEIFGAQRTMLAGAAAPARTRIDNQRAYRLDLSVRPRPRCRRCGPFDALFELAAARRRTLAAEVVKVEYGIVRHMLKLQLIVLRWLLWCGATAVAYACAGANDQVRSAATARISGTMLLTPTI
jgi:hypothetical protein